MKRNSIRLMACLVLCGFMVSVATAQDTKATPRRGANIDQRIEQLDKELTLTADQKTKLKAYFEGVRKKNQDMRADTSLTREQRQEKQRATREDNKKEMKSILTADQFAKWEKDQDKRREEMKQKANQRGKKAEEKTEK
jgi:Spy/CpxP family protein refolding chaperone